MKRSSELRDLSEQHHYILVLARDLRLASEGKKPLGPVLLDLERAWHDEIEAHFHAEEEILLPKCEASLAQRILEEHARIRRAIEEINGDAARAGAFGRALHDHIRFEERVLFPGLEAALSAAELEELGRALHQAASRIARSCAKPPGSGRTGRPAPS